MRQPETVRRNAMTPVPHVVRLLGKLVLEVLPAALASMIGGLLLAHYQFTRAAIAPAPAARESPASPEMVALVRDEHALLRQFLAAQEATQKRQIAADAETGVAKSVTGRVHASAALTEAKPTPPHRKTAGAATAPLPAAPPAGPGPVIIARAQQIAVPAPAAAAQRDKPTLIADTLAVKDQMVGAALHAVKAIGGLPFWVGRRLDGDEVNSQASPAGTAL